MTNFTFDGSDFEIYKNEVTELARREISSVVCLDTLKTSYYSRLDVSEAVSRVIEDTNYWIMLEAKK